MNILFVSGGTTPDYQCDMLFHGLRSLFGPAAVDAGRIAPLYRSDYPDGSPQKAALYGRGFTLYGLLDGDGADRTDLPAKIAARFFDLVVFGSVRRCQTHLHDVLDHYPSDRIAFVDGEDDTLVASALLGRGIYFKRELDNFGPFVAPIGFAIPREKIVASVPEKVRARAFIDPRDRSTYVYGTERDYYADYARSLFGFTTKKAGWDCLRHYEIMANGCIPEFEGLEACPPSTMVFLPKFELLEARGLLAAHGPDVFARPEGRDAWDRLHARIGAVLRRRLTTEALASYVIDTVKRRDGRAAMM